MAFCCAYFALTLTSFSLSWSLGFFIAATFTDFLDGYLARKWNIVTKFGKIVDPIADKILILSILIIFTYQGIVPWFITAIVAAREILLTVLRLFLLSKKIVIASIQSGKLKTISQAAVLITIYLVLIFKTDLIQIIQSSLISDILFGLLLWVAAITLYSGWEFFARNKRILNRYV